MANAEKLAVLGTIFKSDKLKVNVAEFSEMLNCLGVLSDEDQEDLTLISAGWALAKMQEDFNSRTHVERDADNIGDMQTKRG